ncbi:hypothetical protein J2T60_001771 [Natronospira proteinivora]|uniref:HipA-like C-terminal domain-containing protein n=1 Tax=Natronospira proteinivora TaxID=1807133 RepID=A0ABT1G958_9GAMM|nr:HipA domain-containing protein [Natronospira proteinivora]MCP1727771.1 hypothetical protein [Natronospira proteinivora]
MSRHEKLHALLAEQGPLSSATVQKALNISRPTLSRLMRETEGEILRLGQTRRIRYAIPRPLPGLPESIPVARVDEHGRAHPHARLRALEPAEWAWESDDGHLRIGTGLPPEIADCWPAGYMAQALDHSERPDEASLLRLLSERGEDLPGNLIIGEAALARFLALDPSARGMDELPALARAVESGQWPSGLLGGQWPKFTAWMENHQILAKFTPLDSDPVAQRRADLLVAEAVALEMLRKQGIDASPARLIDAEGYRFLCLPRFDRVERLGRRAVIRLAHLRGKGVDPDDWRQSATALRRAARLDNSDAETIAWLAEFAALIGNDDQGGDNLAFFPQEDDKLNLAPVFDMLPMAAAPSADGRIPDVLPEPPLPSGGALERWRSAARLAADYWQRLSNEQKLSFDFRKLAAGQGRQVTDRLERIGG